MEKFLLDIQYWITLKLQSKYWKFKVLLFLVLASFFFQTPRINYFINCLDNPSISSKYNAILIQKEAPFVHHEYELGSHEEKMEFRLFVPLLMRLFSLNIFSVYIIQVVLGVLMLYLLITHIYITTKDKFLSFLFTLGFVFIYSGSSYMIDIYGFYDTFAYVFIIFAFLIINPILIFVFVLISLFVDERSFIACLGLIVYNFFDKRNYKIISSICLAILFAILIRFFLSKYFGLYLHPNQLLAKETFINNINNIGLATVTVFKGFFLIIATSFILLLMNKKYIYSISLFCYYVVSYFSSFIVYDMTRSMSYLILIFPISHIICNQYLNKKSLLKLYLLSTFFCIVIPTYLVQEEIYYIYPFVFDILKYILI